MRAPSYQTRCGIANLPGTGARHFPHRARADWAEYAFSAAPGAVVPAGLASAICIINWIWDRCRNLSGGTARSRSIAPPTLREVVGSDLSGNFERQLEERTMNIAVATPSGHVGSAVADFLLDFGSDIHVKLLGRRPSKLKHLVARGASLATGSQDDVNYLTRATDDVDVLFWVTPPGYGSDDVRAFQNRHGRAAATAIRVNRIKRVVNLSSIWAEMGSGAGRWADCTTSRPASRTWPRT